MGSTTTDRIFRVAVISDIHAHSNDMSATAKNDIPSWVSQADQAPMHNPLVDLLSYIKKQGISADLLLCPGDVADRANDAAMVYAWGQVQAIGSELQVSEVIGAVGNHDLHSRAIDPPAAGVPSTATSSFTLPPTAVKQLVPTYPLKDPSQNTKYWADHVGMYQSTHARVVTVNSCAAHGLIHEGTPEYDKGRFPESVEAKLADLLRESRTKPVNILLTHHHPQQISEPHFTDNSSMINGDRLLRILGNGDHGAWMIVHGHRHVPHFQFGQGDNDRPLVFSAGSLGVILHPRFYPTRPPNQFYIIEFDLEASTQRSSLVGYLNAWNWNHGHGWQPAGDSDPIPDRSGFGNRTPVGQIAQSVSAYIKDRAKAAGRGIFPVLEDDVIAEYPDIQFLLPSERKRLKLKLHEEGITVGAHPTKRGSLIFVFVPNDHEVAPA